MKKVLRLLVGGDCSKQRRSQERRERVQGCKYVGRFNYRLQGLLPLLQYSSQGTSSTLLPPPNLYHSLSPSLFLYISISFSHSRMQAFIGFNKDKTGLVAYLVIVKKKTSKFYLLSFLLTMYLCVGVKERSESYDGIFFSFETLVVRLMIWEVFTG